MTNYRLEWRSLDGIVLDVCCNNEVIAAVTATHGVYCWPRNRFCSSTLSRPRAAAMCNTYNEEEDEDDMRESNRLTTTDRLYRKTQQNRDADLDESHNCFSVPEYFCLPPSLLFPSSSGCAATSLALPQHEHSSSVADVSMSSNHILAASNDYGAVSVIDYSTLQQVTEFNLDVTLPSSSSPSAASIFSRNIMDKHPNNPHTKSSTTHDHRRAVLTTHFLSSRNDVLLCSTANSGLFLLDARVGSASAHSSHLHPGGRGVKSNMMSCVTSSDCVGCTKVNANTWASASEAGQIHLYDLRNPALPFGCINIPDQITSINGDHSSSADACGTNIVLGTYAGRVFRVRAVSAANAASTPCRAFSLFTESEHAFSDDPESHIVDITPNKNIHSKTRNPITAVAIAESRYVAGDSAGHTEVLGRDVSEKHSVRWSLPHHTATAATYSLTPIPTVVCAYAPAVTAADIVTTAESKRNAATHPPKKMSRICFLGK